LFDDLTTAQRALEDLLSNGFDRNDISIVRTNQDTGRDTVTTAGDMDTVSGAATGAGIGAALGGIAGLVIGLGVLAIPGIGPIVAAGPLATTLAGAGIGAATGGIIGALTDVGIPEQEAGYYAEGVRRGGTLLSVRANDDQVSRATEVLNRYSPVDVNQRATEWRSGGWSGFDTNAGTYTGTTSMGAAGGYSGATMADTSSYSTTGTTSQYAGTSGVGSSSMSRFEDFDNDFRTDWETRYRNTGFGYERYQPAYRYGYESRGRYQGRNWTEVESDLRTDWQRSHPNDAWEDFKDSIKTGWERFKEGVRDMGSDVERGMDRAADQMRDTGYDPARTYDRTTSNMSRTFDRYDTDFRSNWEQSYRNQGYGYERYKPAYQYGYDLASESRFRGRQWNEIEFDARRDWETQHPGDKWDDFKDAVRHAWQRVRADVKDAVD
jgi:hypothetical protein